jgi:uncharacterized membrane protein (UPF0127 family)
MQTAVHLPSGRVLASPLEVPNTYIGTGIGLMFRRSFPAGRGILLRHCNGIHMMFVPFPIDAVFLDRRLCVKKVFARLPAWWGLVLFVWGASSVLELPAGAAGELHPGDQIVFT